MRFIDFGRYLFAVSSASLAMLALAYGDFAPMWHALAWLPGRELFVYGFAGLVLVASVGLCIPRTASRSLWVVGSYSAVWAVIAVPQIVAAPLSFGGWYGLVEALTTLSGAVILSRLPVRGAAQIVFGLTCIFYGASHFAYAGYTAAMVPAWLPGPLTLAYLTGLGHICAGLGIILGILPGLAALLEAVMMSLFGLLVWVPSFFMDPRPNWATPPQNQWSELVVTAVVAAAGWIVAISLRDRFYAFRFFKSRSIASDAA